MKRCAYFLFLLCLCVHQSLAQPDPDNAINQLRFLLAQDYPGHPPLVKALAQHNAVQIDQHVFPLAETTLVQYSKEDGNYRVEFFLQQGTAVTSLDDPGFRRAHWTIVLSSKQSCQKFIDLFNQLRVALKKA